MSKSSNILVICAVILVTHMLTLSFPTVDSAAASHLTWIPTTTVATTSGCRGSMAECLAEGGDLNIEDDDEDEFSLDSEINRRILATNRRYISYGALSKNNVPCSRRGASYYNCRRGGQANPYSRGCSAITRCRR
uniref:protein RALF-like 33 n=1 Tax=Erigeron canadensis TaxID=72917 RepID=UPI001CB8C6A3|nr:protein RALF-like 33 [Erigeron canadensis]